MCGCADMQMCECADVRMFMVHGSWFMAGVGKVAVAVAVAAGSLFMDHSRWGRVAVVAGS